MNCTAFLHSDSSPPSPQHFPFSRGPAPTPARPTRRPAPSSRLPANVPPARDIRVQRPHDLRRTEVGSFSEVGFGSGRCLCLGHTLSWIGCIAQAVGGRQRMVTISKDNDV